MTFTGRLRLALILAAILPMILITVIVVAAVKQQIKRIEHREAASACDRFAQLLENTTTRVEQSIISVAGEQRFKLMELGVRSRRRAGPQYHLPLSSLDFLEYIDSSGTVLASANRPALVGRPYPGIGEAPVSADDTPLPRFRFENDLRGSHPSLGLMPATETGFLVGGLYLDGSFVQLAEAVTRSHIAFVDLRNGNSDEDGIHSTIGVGRPYRSDGRLLAQLHRDPGGELRIEGYFPPGGQASLFSDFFTAVAAVMLFSLAVAIPAGLYFSSQTRRKIAGLTDGAARVAAGDFSRPVIEASAGEFGDLADSFNQMMKQLTDYRDRLIVSQKIAAWQTIGRKVAHEVKNPLTPIAIAADDLRHSFAEKRGDFEQILTSSTTTIRNEVDRLKKLIDQFSAFARMPAPEISRVDAKAFVEELSVLFTEEISSGRLTLTNDLGRPDISIDPDQIRQVIINLIKNSLETDCRNTIVVFRFDRDHLIITVEDDGPGFPAKILNDGITPYYSTKDGGSGLGLLISQRIIFDHDGTIILDNKPQGGAQVVISVPQSHA